MQMPIPDDWDGESFCRWTICWPNSVKWQAILSGLVEMPTQGRFWDFNTGDFLALRDLFKPAYDYNFDLKECFMACNDTGLSEIAAALRQMAVSIQATAQSNANCCGGGSAGQGQSPPPYNPTEQGDPGSDPPPDGFDSWEQFFANKCAVATDIVTTIRGDIGRMTTINLVGLTLVSLIPVLLGLLLDPIPGDEIAVIGALLLAALGLGAGMLDNMGDVIDNHFDELVCALYEALSSAAAETAIEAAFSQFWDDDGHGTQPYSFSAKMLFATLVGPASTNRLFTLETTRTLPEGDCSTCVECIGSNWENWSIEFGTLQSIDPPTIFVAPEAAGGYYYVALLLSIDPMVIDQIRFSLASDLADNFHVSVYTYTAAVPYPGAWNEVVTETQLPPHNFVLDFTSTNEVAQVYLEIRPVSTGLSYDHAEVANMCIE